MPAATRIGDFNTGHDCHKPVPALQGSSTVFVNGIGVNRQDDTWEPHACGGSPHTGKTAMGSSTVAVNNKPVTRIGDPVDCGAFSAEGSNTVFIGG
jgi:uncharacterized Zn-binding protein involved in type VI secretion